MKVNCSLRKNLNKIYCKKSVGEAEFSIVLPKKDNSGRPIRPKILKKYIGEVNKIFGGSTTLPITKGCYFDKNKLQCENGFKISGVLDFNSKYNKSLSKLNAYERKIRISTDYARLRRVARMAGKELGQDSIMIMSDSINDASFVPGTWKKKIQKSKTGKREIFN